MVQAVRKQLGGSASTLAAERAVDSVLAAIKAGLRRDKEVQLVGFGTFASLVRAARRGFNPHSRQPMRIPAARTVRFKAGSDLKSLP